MIAAGWMLFVVTASALARSAQEICPDVVGLLLLFYIMWHCLPNWLSELWPRRHFGPVIYNFLLRLSLPLFSLEERTFRTCFSPNKEQPPVAQVSANETELPA